MKYVVPIIIFVILIISLTSYKITNSNAGELNDLDSSAPVVTDKYWEPLRGVALGGSITSFWFIDYQRGWVAMSDGTLLQTHDGGITWEGNQWPFLNENQVYITSLQFILHGENKINGWAVSTNGGLLKTIDGNTWSVVDAPKALDVFVVDKDTIFIVIEYGKILRSDNGGISWNANNEISKNLKYNDPHPDYDFIHFGHKKGVVFFQTYNEWSIRTTLDNGLTWTTQIKELKNMSDKWFSIIREKESIFAYYGDELLYSSGSLNISEETINRLLKRQNKNSRFFSKLHRTYHIISKDFIVVKEQDRGRDRNIDIIRVSKDEATSWSRLFRTSRASDIYFHDKLSGWMVGSGGRVSKTNDGGESWTHTFLPTIQDNFYTVIFFDENNGWVGGGKYGDNYRGEGYIWRTEDGGKKWNLSTLVTNKFNQYKNQKIKDIVFQDKKNGWAVSHGLEKETVGDGYYGREYGRIFNTNDGGMVWNEVYFGMPLFSVDVKNNIILASGNGWLRSDQENQWIEIEGPGVMLDVSFINDNNVLSVGEQADCYLSVDAGKRFRSIKDKSFERKHLYVVEFADDSIGWMGGWISGDGNHYGIFKTTDGGISWEPSIVKSMEHAFYLPFAWKGITVVDLDHAWIISENNILTLRSTDSNK